MPQRKSPLSKEECRKLLLSAVKKGMTYKQAAAVAEISYRTALRWRRTDFDLRAALEDVYGEQTLAVEKSLWKKACEGHVLACIFWLCNRAPERWRHVQNVNVRHKGSVVQDVRYADVVKLAEKLAAVAREVGLSLDGHPVGAIIHSAPPTDRRLSAPPETNGLPLGEAGGTLVRGGEQEREDDGGGG